MATHFEGCVLLAESYDEYRKRVTKVFALPGDFARAGYSDGVDSFIIPANGVPFGQNKVDIAAALESLRTGTFKGPSLGGKTRRVRIQAYEQIQQPTTRRRIHVEV
jgi:hypothetical protein